MVSALHHGGRRLYELAREGKEVDRAPRAIQVTRFELQSFTPPRARFSVSCSKGTYVRGLVRDVGAELGCGATLTALRRTQAGRFTLSDALPLADLTAARAAERLILPHDAVAHLPAVELDAAMQRAATCGQPLLAPGGQLDGSLARLLTVAGSLVAVAEIRGGRMRTLRVFNYGLT
jgi:tRNA pseudouridine55 synthase